MTNDTIKGIPIDEIVAEYNLVGNVWKVGEKFGISGQTIHTRLSRIGVIKKMNVFSDEEKAILLREYESFKCKGELSILAQRLGRTKQFINRKARELGLTGRVKSYNYSVEKHAELSRAAKKRIKKYGHPCGMAGEKHSTESKLKMQDSSKRMWGDANCVLRDEEHRRARSDRTMEMQKDCRLGTRSRTYMCEVSVGGKMFTVKSTWEYDIAMYLEYLKSAGYITDWNYEPKAFRFKYDKSGVRTYRPDFVVLKDDEEYYIEVKGWQDEKYLIKRKKMAEEYPNVKMIYICDKEYYAIQRKHKVDIPEWGKLKERIVADKFIDKNNPRIEFRLIEV